MTDLALLPAHEQALRLRRREVSALELLDHHLARVARLNPAINAVVLLDAERARARAREADAALATGQVWGPLHGVPMTVKESFDVPGLPTCWGYEQFQHNIAHQPAVAVQRLLDAGAVVFGKTNVPVSLADWQTFNPVYGTTHNPWDVARVPGGSSGGSAAALAAGLTALELGSDIGASIRNPAHYCGVYGHKPSWGMVPMLGHQLPGTTCIDSLDLAVAGPLARSATDLSLAMQVLCTPVQQFGVHGWTPSQWRDSGTHPSRCKVALLLDDAQAPVDAAVQARLLALSDFLQQQGVQVHAQHRPVDSAQAHRVYVQLLRAATGAWMGDADFAQAQAQAKALSADDQSYPAWMLRGATLTHRDWVRLDQERALLRQQWQAFFEDFDFLICPIATTVAFAHNQAGERWQRMVDVNGQPQPSTQALFWAGYPGVVGLPATAIPLGLTPDGLPVGAQVIGPLRGDLQCLRFAQWMEEAWCGFTPPPMAEQ